MPKLTDVFNSVNSLKDELAFLKESYDAVVKGRPFDIIVTESITPEMYICFEDLNIFLTKRHGNLRLHIVPNHFRGGGELYTQIGIIRELILTGTIRKIVQRRIWN